MSGPTPWSECLADAARALQAARARRDALPARQAAEEAYLPGGPSVADLEAQIRAHRAQALKAAS